MAIPIQVSFEADDNEVELTFLIEKEGGEDEPEWSIDYGHIEVRENGGPIPMVRTWAELQKIYSPDHLEVALDRAKDLAADQWEASDDFTEEEPD